jgi:hypothetical protein
LNTLLSTVPNSGIPVTAAWRKKAKDALTADMKPEDWRGLISGLLEFLGEEAEEPEHADDCVMDAGLALDESVRTEDVDGRMRVIVIKGRLLAFDKSTKERDIDGRLHVADASICLECVSDYLGKEVPGYQDLGLDPEKIYQLYRPGEELEKAVATANGIPVLRRHVETSADDHKYWDTIGATGTNAKWESPIIKNDLVIWPNEDIAGIDSKSKTGLSPGYHYVPVLEDGVFKGKPYQIRMKDIYFNHLAVVEEGRQGPRIVIDSAADLGWAAVEQAILSLS